MMRIARAPHFSFPLRPIGGEKIKVRSGVRVSRVEETRLTQPSPPEGANTIEGFWSILKRGMVGTFNKVSRKYMPLYVAEFSFRYSNRENEDIFGTAIAGC